jgi:hypothetical protein
VDIWEWWKELMARVLNPSADFEEVSDSKTIVTFSNTPHQQQECTAINNLQLAKTEAVDRL